MSSRALRDRLGTVLLILALWLQALAPGAALRLPPPDPLAHAIICGHGIEAAVAAEDGMPGPCAACPFCTGIALAPLVPTGPRVARTARWHAVAWATPPPIPSLRRPRPAGQPRAPPLSS
ncbi:hypothetical protein ASF22_04445 [Methylobacterium sp. Leaf87]|uniref:hypothetical protein n=1 Tax=Methylobacterium sp. Leaf87 TaxID=1736243 RepID=UPI0006FB5542|nr:hypothetical protein [Methylobacterium sp. Leaf87]KQO65926.1 hypothetical protein ASF22_04445 [Methylobacterium sp. Leaf87]